MINTLRLETYMNYLTRDSRQYIQANIKCENTNDPHEPVEIVITSPTNLLLYFQIRITPQLAMEMCSRLLMEQKKPEDFPAYIESLIKDKPSTRQFNLVADDETHFKLGVNDIIQQQLFPRLSLPMIKLSSDVVQQYLRDLLTEERQFTKESKQRIKALEIQLQDEQQMYQNQIEQIMKSEQQAKYQMEKAQQEFQQLNSQYLAEKTQMQSTIERKTHENMLQQTQLDQQSMQIQQQILSIEQLNRELQETAINLKTQSTTAELLQKQLNDRTQALESLRMQNQQLNDEKVQNIAQLSQQASKIRQQDGQIQSLEQQLQKTTTEMQKRIDSLQTQAQQDQNRLLTLTREARDLAYQGEQAKSQCAQLQKTLQDTQDKLQETVGKLEVQVTQNENLTKLNQEMSEQLKQTQTTRDDLERMKIQYSTELEDLKAELKTLGREAAEYKQRAEHAERKTGVDIMNYLQGDRLPLDQRRENQEQLERVLREAKLAGVRNRSSHVQSGLSPAPAASDEWRSASAVDQSMYRPAARPPRQNVPGTTTESLYGTQTDGSVLSGYSKFFRQSTVAPRAPVGQRSHSASPQAATGGSSSGNNNNNIRFLDLGKFLEDDPRLPPAPENRLGDPGNIGNNAVDDVQRLIESMKQSIIPAPLDVAISSSTTHSIQHASDSSSAVTVGSIVSAASATGAMQLTQRSSEKKSQNDVLMDQYLNMLNEDIE